MKKIEDKNRKVRIRESLPQPNLRGKEIRQTSTTLPAAVKEIVYRPVPWKVFRRGHSLSYLIRPLFPLGTISMVSGKSGVGKSTVIASIIKAISTGEKLWGEFPVQKGGRCLLIDQENPESVLIKRLKKMGFFKNFPLDILHFKNVRLDKKKNFKAFLRMVKRKKFLFIVFDSLVRVHRLKENDAAQMARVIDSLRTLANMETHVLIVHHSKKDGQSNNQGSVRGSTDIVAGVDIAYNLTGDDYGNLRLKTVKNRFKPIKPIRLKMVSEGKRLEIIFRSQENMRKKTLNAVMELLKEGKEMSFREIKDELDQKGMRKGEADLRQILQSAVGKELSVRIGGRNAHYYSLKLAGSRNTPRLRE